MGNVTKINIEEIKKKINIEEEKELTLLLLELDNFYYYYDLFSKTKYREIFISRYIKVPPLTYLTIALNIGSDSSQINRVVNKMEEHIKNIIKKEEKYKNLRKYYA